MIEIKNKDLTLLIISLCNVIILTFGHVYDDRIIMLASITVFAASVILSPKANFFPLMLFYLPWSNVLRIRPDSYTFFTLVVPVVFLLLIINSLKTDQKYPKRILLFSIIITTYTLIIKFFNMLPIHMEYLFFIMMLFYIPFYISKYKKDIRFEKCVLFLTTSMIMASIVSYLLINNPNMHDYIRVYIETDYNLTRFSAFNNDPNYYAMQILVTIAALLIVLSKTTRKIIIVLQITSIMILMYFGFLSVSKMFLFTIAGLGLLWFFSLLIAQRRLSYKIGLIVGLTIIAIVFIASNLFAEQITLYLIRFGFVGNVTTLTTGRDVYSGIYLNYLLSHPEKLFFGIGLSVDQLLEMLNTNNAHDSLVEIMYQLGITGGILLFFWWKGIYQEMAENNKLSFAELMNFSIMAAAVFLPWLVLDLLYFDDFFYFTILLFVSRNFILKERYIK